MLPNFLSEDLPFDGRTLERAANALERTVRDRLGPDAVANSGVVRSPFPCFFCQLEATAELDPDEFEAVRHQLSRDETLADISTHLVSPWMLPRENGYGFLRGLAAGTEADLERARATVERAAEFDHRALAPELGLVRWSEESGDIAWQPEGLILRRNIERLVEQALELTAFQPVESGAIAFDWFHEVPGQSGHRAVAKALPRGLRSLPLRFYEWTKGGEDGGPSLRDLRDGPTLLFSSFASPRRAASEWSALTAGLADLLRSFGIQANVLDSAPAETTESTESTGEDGDDGLPGDLRSLLVCPNVFGASLDTLGGLRLLGSSGLALRDARWSPVEIRGMLSVGSIVATVIETHRGDLPLELAPVQVRVFSLSEAAAGYAEDVSRRIQRAGFRSEADGRRTKLLTKERDAARLRRPYVLLVGPREADARAATVRRRGEERRQETIAVDEFISRLGFELEERRARYQNSFSPPAP